MKHANETAMEYLRRAINNLDYEHETILDALPTNEAVIEYFELWTVYDTEFLSGIMECIEDGADPKPLIDFTKKYNITWKI